MSASWKGHLAQTSRDWNSPTDTAGTPLEHRSQCRQHFQHRSEGADFEQLRSIYAHLDSTTTVAAMTGQAA